MLTNVAIYSEGVDVPVASCMLQCRPTCSDAVYAQMLGRVLRTYEGKTEALVLDCVPQDARDLFLAGDLLEGVDEFAYKDKRLAWHTEKNLIVAMVAKGIEVAAIRANGVYQVVRVRTAEPQESRWLGTAENWEEVLTYVDALGGFEWWLSSKNAKWRSRPATPRQERYLRMLGRWSPGMSCGRAAETISAIHAVRVIMTRPMDETRPIVLSRTERNDKPRKEKLTERLARIGL